MADMKIGLALSGGGYRATVFHLGVLARLAKGNMLENIEMISTVSGGSLAIGLVYCSNNNRWPTRGQYIQNCLPEAYMRLTTENLQLNVILDALFRPLQLLASRAGLVSRNLRKSWKVTAQLNELPPEPRWIINATCYETSRNFRFETFASTFQAARMGSSGLGYVRNPSIPLSDALAASAGFPVAIGPLGINTARYEWVDYKKGSRRDIEEIPRPPYKKLHLWDGGVYDNLGLEPLVNYSSESGDVAYRSGIDTLLVSNASGRMKDKAYRAGVQAVDRLISIPKYQIEALRSRDTIHRFRAHNGAGNYFKTGNSCLKLLQSSDLTPEEINTITGDYLSQDDVDRAADFSTTLRRLERDEFMLLFRHGFEVADCTMHVFGNPVQPLLRYEKDYWERTVFKI